MARKVCCICGKEMSSWSLDCVPLQIKHKGERLVECKSCLNKYKGKPLSVQENGRAIVLEYEDTEVRKKCNVCGHLYCYNFKDLEQNRRNADRALMDGVSALGHAVGGSSTASAINNANARSALGGIVDFNRCPHCGSLDVREITKDEWAAEQAKAQTPVAPARSSADELKSFKELLDMGIITQEEFDAKKKQLLGL